MIILTQVWTARKVPYLVPDFVDYHITVADNGFIFEVDPSHETFHETFKDSKNVNKAVKDYLRANGFIDISLIYEGERPGDLPFN